ncbi:MAG: hypothetical protein HYV45_02720 [Candidatus Moranbacteria bacterium]|nr:hypothetical protein [Candidatus Moranbacteria bacterium]
MTAIGAHTASVYCYGISGATWYGSGWTTVPFTVAAPAIPPQPASVTGSCPVPGTVANISWPASLGATFYALRSDNQSNGWQGTCAGAYVGDVCIDNVASTSYVINPSTPGASYNTWVHACNAGGCSPGAASTIFTCIPPAPAVTFTINGSTGPLTLTQGSTKNFAWTVTNATSCTASSSDGWSGSKNPSSGTETGTANITSDHTLSCTGLGGTTEKTVRVNVTCTPSTGSWGPCSNCVNETKERANINASCGTWTETTDCSPTEKNTCRDFNRKEVAP